MKNRVVHFEIQADNVERAANFYKKAFGWDIKKYEAKDPKDTESMGMDYWMVMTGPKETPGINGGMYIRMPERKLHTFDCTIQVDDIDKAITDVKMNGGMIEGEKMEMKGVGWFARAKDTEGNMFGLMQATNPDMEM